MTDRKSLKPCAPSICPAWIYVSGIPAAPRVVQRREENGMKGFAKIAAEKYPKNHGCDAGIKQECDQHTKLSLWLHDFFHESKDNGHEGSVAKIPHHHPEDYPKPRCGHRGCIKQPPSAAAGNTDFCPSRKIRSCLVCLRRTAATIHFKPTTPKRCAPLTVSCF